MIHIMASRRTTSMVPVALLLLTTVLTLPSCGGSGGGASGSASTAAGVGSRDLLGPRIDITSPADGTVAPGNQAILDAVVADVGRGVTKVTVDGQEVATSAGPIQATVPIEAGLNTIVVEAWDAQGGRTERHVSVLGGRLDGAPIADGLEVALGGSATSLLSRFQTTTTTGGSGGVPNGMPPVRWIPAHSRNQSSRSGSAIRYVVIHTIEGSEAGAISWFQNPSSQVSAHYIVSHAGRVTQMVREADKAWHATVYNSSSIGIENEGYAGRNTWTDAEYRALAQLTRSICDRHGIPKDRQHIIGHYEVPGSGKSDPGRFFDWTRFLNLVRGAGGTTTATRPRPSQVTVTTATGKDLEVSYTPKPARTAGGTTTIELDVDVSAASPLPGRLDRSVVTGSRRAPLPALANGANVGVTVHQDALNRALHAAWRGGALDVRLTSALLTQVAPVSTATLDADELVLSEPALGSVLAAGAKLELELTPGLPPVARVDRRGLIELGLGSLRVQLEAVGTGRALKALGQVTVALRARAALDGPGGLGHLTLVGPPTIHVDIAPGMTGEEELSVRRLARAIAPALVDGALGALSGVPLALPGGINLRAADVASEGQTVSVVGVQR